MSPTSEPEGRPAVVTFEQIAFFMYEGCFDLSLIQMVTIIMEEVSAGAQ